MSILIPAGGSLPAPAAREPDAPETLRKWLARAHEAPSQARSEWTAQGVALLPLGWTFGAIRIPGTLVHAAVGSDEPQAVAEFLSGALQGPVIHDTMAVGRFYYALVPEWPHATWSGATDTPYLGRDFFLGVPDIGRTEPPGTYWVVQPYHCRVLCRREVVFDFIVRAHQAIREEADDDAGDA